MGKSGNPGGIPRHLLKPPENSLLSLDIMEGVESKSLAIDCEGAKSITNGLTPDSQAIGNEQGDKPTDELHKTDYTTGPNV